MSKRSAQEKIDYYSAKIRKLEQKQIRRRIVTPIVSSDDEGNGVVENTTIDNTNGSPADEVVTSVPACEQNIGSATENDISQNKDQPGTSTPDNGTEAVTPSDEPDLDPELLLALGESTSDNPEYGDNIHSNLAKLWLPLLKKGMPKDSKEKMVKDYLVPDNCRLLQSPKLNAEISAAVPDMVRNRDKVVAASQQQLGKGITAINRGIDFLLKQDDKIQAMKHLSNGCRLLCDSHYLITQNRIKLIMPSLDKTFLNIVHDSERDDSLFGSSLSEKIKAAKAIEKQGLQIKNKPPSKAQKQPSQANSRPSNSYSGNWPAPPRYSANRGGRGGSRKPSTTTTRRPYAASLPRTTNLQQDKFRAPAHQ